MLQDQTRIAWLRRWLAPPVFEGDAERTRRAELLNAIVLGLLAVLVAYCVVRLFMLDINSSFLSIAGAIALLELVVWSLMRNGQVQWASLIQVGALWLVISMVNYIAGGVQASGSVIYALLIVMAGQLLGWQGGVLFLGLGLASELYFVYAEGAGTLPPLQADVTPLDTWMVHAVALAMMGLLLSMSNRRLVGALERVSRNERQWMESNLELQAARTALEQRDAYLRAKTQQYVEYAMAVGTGDLTLRLDVQDDGHEGTAEYDPLVVLGHQLNDMVTALQYMIGQIRAAANNLGTAATEILAATTEQASGAAEQSAAIAQTTSTVDEVRTISEQATLRAQEVAGSSRRTVEVANAGQQAVQDTIESMYDIRDRVEGIAENILSLSEQTQQIGEIIATVSEIAAQSNMLALNASVEAARAGEAGRGFAVVAAEVRNLAEQSRQATVQVKAILSEIQRATNATVMATEEGSKGVDKGVHLAVQAQASIEELAGVINESAQAAAQMVAGGQQQAGGIGQIALAMQSINQATVQSLSSTRQAEKAARDLNELARGLTAVVEEYKLS